MRVQRTCVASVAAQVAVGYLKKYSRGKNYRDAGSVFFLCTTAAQSIYRQIKIKIDHFTNVYYTWNVYLAT